MDNYATIRVHIKEGKRALKEGNKIIKHPIYHVFIESDVCRKSCANPVCNDCMHTALGQGMMNVCCDPYNSKTSGQSWGTSRLKICIPHCHECLPLTDLKHVQEVVIYVNLKYNKTVFSILKKQSTLV